jgi:hypothetical protein
MGGAKGTGGGGGSNLDAKADTQVPTSTGGALGTPDSGLDQAAPGTGGTGGTVVLDGGIDMTGSSPEAGRDVALETAAPDGQVPDVAAVPDGGGVDVAPVEAGNSEAGPSSCQSPSFARSYTLPPLYAIAWAKDNTLVTAGDFLPNDTSLGGKTLTNQGASDMFVAGIDPKTGSANWILTAGDNNDQSASQVATSSNAVVGVIGTYAGTMEILTGSPITNPTQNPVNFIAGIDGTAGAGLWSKSVNLGTGGLNAIAGHTNQDFFVVCGAATNTAAQLGVTGATPGGGKDVAVAAIKSIDGTVIWAKLFGGAMDQTCNAAAIDDDGNVLLAGSYTGTLNFGAGALTPAPTGTLDQILWVAKLDGTTGAAIAAQAYGTSGKIFPASITADAQGNVFVAGYFGAAFSVGTTLLTPLGSDSFAMKVSAGLAPLWARRWGSAGHVTTSSGIATDSSGNPTVVGDFQGTIDIGPGSAVLSANAPTGTGLDVFVASLDGATGATTCAHHYGDSSALASQDAQGVAINRWATGAGKDSIAIVGNYVGVIDFGPPTTALNAGTSSSQARYLLELQP